MRYIYINIIYAKSRRFITCISSMLPIAQWSQWSSRSFSQGCKAIGHSTGSEVHPAGWTWEAGPTRRVQWNLLGADSGRWYTLKKNSHILSRPETPNSVVGGIGKRTRYHESTHMRAHTWEHTHRSIHMRAHMKAHRWEHTYDSTEESTDMGALIWEHIWKHTDESTEEHT